MFSAKKAPKELFDRMSNYSAPVHHCTDCTDTTTYGSPFNSLCFRCAQDYIGKRSSSSNQN